MDAARRPLVCPPPPVQSKAAPRRFPLQHIRPPKIPLAPQTRTQAPQWRTLYDEVPGVQQRRSLPAPSPTRRLPPPLRQGQRTLYDEVP